MLRWRVAIVVASVRFLVSSSVIVAVDRLLSSVSLELSSVSCLFVVE